MAFAVFLGFFALAAGATIMPRHSHANGPPDLPPDLPHAQGRDFATLDAYLAHLEKLGEIGITWYERMPDGRYQMIRRRRPGSAPRIFTRQELLERFGFDE